MEGSFYESWSDRSFELEDNALQYEQCADDEYTEENLLYNDQAITDEDEEAILRAIDSNLEKFDLDHAQMLEGYDYENLDVNLALEYEEDYAAGDEVEIPDLSLDDYISGRDDTEEFSHDVESFVSIPNQSSASDSLNDNSAKLDVINEFHEEVPAFSACDEEESKITTSEFNDTKQLKECTHDISAINDSNSTEQACINEPSCEEIVLNQSISQVEKRDGILLEEENNSYKPLIPEHNAMLKEVPVETEPLSSAISKDTNLVIEILQKSEVSDTKILKTDSSNEEESNDPKSSGSLVPESLSDLKTVEPDIAEHKTSVKVEKSDREAQEIIPDVELDHRVPKESESLQDNSVIMKPEYLKCVADSEEKISPLSDATQSISHEEKAPVLLKQDVLDEQKTFKSVVSKENSSLESNSYKSVESEISSTATTDAHELENSESTIISKTDVSGASKRDSLLISEVSQKYNSETKTQELSSKPKAVKQEIIPIETLKSDSVPKSKASSEVFESPDTESKDSVESDAPKSAVSQKELTSAPETFQSDTTHEKLASETEISMIREKECFPDKEVSLEAPVQDSTVDLSDAKTTLEKDSLKKEDSSNSKLSGSVVCETETSLEARKESAPDVSKNEPFIEVEKSDSKPLLSPEIPPKPPIHEKSDRYLSDSKDIPVEVKDGDSIFSERKHSETISSDNLIKTETLSSAVDKPNFPEKPDKVGPTQPILTDAAVDVEQVITTAAGNATKSSTDEVQVVSNEKSSTDTKNTSQINLETTNSLKDVSTPKDSKITSSETSPLGSDENSSKNIAQVEQDAPNLPPKKPKISSQTFQESLEAASEEKPVIPRKLSLCRRSPSIIELVPDTETSLEKTLSCPAESVNNLEKASIPCKKQDSEVIASTDDKRVPEQASRRVRKRSVPEVPAEKSQQDTTKIPPRRRSRVSSIDSDKSEEESVKPPRRRSRTVEQIENDNKSISSERKSSIDKDMKAPELPKKRLSIDAEAKSSLSSGSDIKCISDNRRKSSIDSDVRIPDLPKKRLSIEDRMLKLQQEGKCNNRDNAFIAAKLIEMQFEEEDAIMASKQCTNVYNAVKFLTQLCEMCSCRQPINQMASMVHCPHKACKDCLKAHFTSLIYDRSIFSLLCPICHKPDISDHNIQDYFNHLDMMLRNILVKDVYDLFQRKLRDEVLTKDPNFHWCSQCSSGFIASPRLKKLYCPDCSAITCALCHQTWELEHEGVHCERFQQWKDMHTPEPPPAGLVKALAERGVTCPSCGIKYTHASGGCMHYKCTHCNLEFCAFCMKRYKKAKECESLPVCGNLGTHCHHAKNCLFFFRDNEASQLQQILSEKQVSCLKIPPPDQIVKSRCQVREQKHLHGAITEDRCLRDIEPYMAGLCRTHYMEYLCELMRKNKINPLPSMTTLELQFVMRKGRIFIPEKVKGESCDEYHSRLLKEIDKYLPS